MSAESGSEAGGSDRPEASLTDWWCGGQRGERIVEREEIGVDEGSASEIEGKG